MTAVPRFYLGVHMPVWLGDSRRRRVPLFVSHVRLRHRKTLPRAVGPWALDSGGFSELSLRGAWSDSSTAYATAVRRYVDEIGKLDFAAIQDWMCEPFVLEKTKGTVELHQARTIQSLVDLRSIAPEIPWLPVLQGFTRGEYLHHVESYARAGVDLTREPLVGVGSICRRQATGEAEDILRELQSLGIRVHGFGLKKQGLARCSPVLASADSMAWSFDARRKPKQKGCQHPKCNNCLVYALNWYREVVDGFKRRSNEGNDRDLGAACVVVAGNERRARGGARGGRALGAGDASSRDRRNDEPHLRDGGTAREGRGERSEAGAAQERVGLTELKPFFYYFGAKHRAAPFYPAPTHDHIIEPFAGAAGYSLRHAGARQVTLIDKFPAIVETWRYLLRVSAKEILALPDLRKGQTVDDLKVPPEAKMLIGWWLNHGCRMPYKSPSAWMRSGIRPNSFWGDSVRQRIAAQLDRIRHWKILEGDYTQALDVEATWFIDPPYVGAGTNYKFGSQLLDFKALAAWCRSRRGQVMVCESDQATWLPFRFMRTTRANSNRWGARVMHEGLWTNEQPRLTFLPISTWDKDFVAAVKRHYTGSAGAPPGKKIAYAIYEQKGEGPGAGHVVGWIGLGEPPFKLAPRRALGIADARPLPQTVCCFIYRLEGARDISASDILDAWHPVAARDWKDRYGWEPIHWETMVGQGAEGNHGACFKRAGYRTLGLTTGRTARRPPGSTHGARVWGDGTAKLVLYRGPLARVAEQGAAGWHDRGSGKLVAEFTTRERAGRKMGGCVGRLGGVRKCSTCGKTRSADAFYEKTRHECRDCETRRRAAHRAANLEQERERQRLSERELRLDLLDAYGGCCVCCGEVRWMLLSIDHKNNDGAEERRKHKSPKSFYRWLRESGYPKDRYQLLCHNCNAAKGFYSECPHETEKRAGVGSFPETSSLARARLTGFGFCPSSLEELDSISGSAKLFQVLSRCVVSRGTPSPPVSWFKRWKSNAWLRALCSRMLEPSTADAGVEQWISSLRASPVSRRALQESGSGRRILDGSGLRSHEFFASARRLLSFSKTSPASSRSTTAKRSRKSSSVSKTSGSISWRAAFAPPLMSELRISESASSSSRSRATTAEGGGSWPTPSTIESETRTNKGGMAGRVGPERPLLAGRAASGTWATPLAGTATGGDRTHSTPDGKRGRDLAAQAVTPSAWPTPTTQNDQGPDDSAREGGPTLVSTASMWATPLSRDGKDGACANQPDVPTNNMLGREAVRWQTPTVEDSESRGWTNSHGERFASLTGQARETPWPTPTAEIQTKSTRAMTASVDNGRRSGGGQSSPPGLEQTARIVMGETPRELPPLSELPPATRALVEASRRGLPVPTTAKAGRGSSRSSPDSSRPSNGRTANPLGGGRVLNPRFVAALMGWQIGHTEFRGEWAGVSASPILASSTESTSSASSATASSSQLPVPRSSSSRDGSVGRSPVRSPLEILQRMLERALGAGG